jgi:hypothetical protein
VSEPTEQLHIYLNDHLAGSVAAIELLDDLIKHYEAHRLTNFFSDLRTEIVADQEILRHLLDKIGGEESSLRKAGAWLAEKLGRAKLRFGDKNSIGLLQALEALALGVTGKQLLWQSLAAIADTLVALQGTDFAALESRARGQIDRIETEHLGLSQEILSDRAHS